MPVASSFDLAPEQAVAFFRDKELLASFAWQDVWRQEHEVAFTVAKMADLDLLSDMRDAVDAAIAEGLTLEQFKARITPTLVKAGWWGVKEQVDPDTGQKQLVQLGSPRRLQTIFRTNMMTSYSAGEWQNIVDSADDAPYLMYDAVDDNRTRPQHHAWDGTVLRWDDPWWQTHRPPNGYNCRCSVIQLGADDLSLVGKTKPDKAPPVKTREWTNRRTGEVMKVPLGIDPGFDYNPGQDRKAQLQHLAQLKRAEFDKGSAK